MLCIAGISTEPQERKKSLGKASCKISETGELFLVMFQEKRLRLKRRSWLREDAKDLLGEESS